MKPQRVVLICTMIMFSIPILLTGQPKDRTPYPDRRELENQLRQTIQTLRAVRLREALNLSDEQGSRLFQILQEQDQTERHFHVSRRALLQSLKQQMQDEDTPDAELRRLHGELKTIRQQHIQDTLQYQDRIEEFLTPRQQVKYHFFQESFRRHVERFTRGMRQPGARHESARPLERHRPKRQQRADDREPPR